MDRGGGRTDGDLSLSRTPRRLRSRSATVYYWRTAVGSSEGSVFRSSHRQEKSPIPPSDTTLLLGLDHAIERPGTSTDFSLATIPGKYSVDIEVTTPFGAFPAGELAWVAHASRLMTVT